MKYIVGIVVLALIIVSYFVFNEDKPNIVENQTVGVKNSSSQNAVVKVEHEDNLSFQKENSVATDPNIEGEPLDEDSANGLTNSTVRLQDVDTVEKLDYLLVSQVEGQSSASLDAQNFRKIDEDLLQNVFDTLDSGASSQAVANVDTFTNTFIENDIPVDLQRMSCSDDYCLVNLSLDIDSSLNEVMHETNSKLNIGGASLIRKIDKDNGYQQNIVFLFSTSNNINSIKIPSR